MIRPFPRQAEGRSPSQAHTESMRQPFPRQAGGKPISSTHQVHEMVFSLTGRGGSPSQARAKSMRWPFPRQAGRKADRKQHSNTLFLHRQGESPPRAIPGSPEVYFSSTGREESPSCARPPRPPRSPNAFRRAVSVDKLLFRVRQVEKAISKRSPYNLHGL